MIIADLIVGLQKTLLVKFVLIVPILIDFLQFEVILIIVIMCHHFRGCAVLIVTNVILWLFKLGKWDATLLILNILLTIANFLGRGSVA